MNQDNYGFLSQCHCSFESRAILRSAHSNSSYGQLRPNGAVKSQLLKNVVLLPHEILLAHGECLELAGIDGASDFAAGNGYRTLDGIALKFSLFHQ